MSIDGYLSELAKAGILGVILVVSWIAAGFTIRTLFTLLIDEMTKRRESAEKFNDGLIEPIRQLQKNGETQNTLLNRLLELAVQKKP